MTTMTLIRDKMPAIIEAETGKKCRTVKIFGQLYIDELTQNLKEKAVECRHTASDHKLEKMADIMEVFHALMHEYGLTMDQIETARLKKREQEGGFDDHIYLEALMDAD